MKINLQNFSMSEMTVAVLLVGSILMWLYYHLGPLQ